jgi:hypothetical protein
MDIIIGKSMNPGFGTVLDDQGNILGIVQYAPGQHITEVVRQMLIDNGREFTMLSFDKTTITNSVDFTDIEGVMINEDEETVSFELSFTPTGFYKAAA